jgi:hypothetical protein
MANLAEQLYQERLTHDAARAFLAVRKCAAEFDWDAIVANMVYVWTGLTEAIPMISRQDLRPRSALVHP